MGNFWMVLFGFVARAVNAIVRRSFTAPVMAEQKQQPSNSLSPAALEKADVPAPTPPTHWQAFLNRGGPPPHWLALFEDSATRPQWFEYSGGEDIQFVQESTPTPENTDIGIAATAEVQSGSLPTEEPAPLTGPITPPGRAAAPPVSSSAQRKPPAQGVLLKPASRAFKNRAYQPPVQPSAEAFAPSLPPVESELAQAAPGLSALRRPRWGAQAVEPPRVETSPLQPARANLLQRLLKPFAPRQTAQPHSAPAPQPVFEPNHAPLPQISAPAVRQSPAAEKSASSAEPVRETRLATEHAAQSVPAKFETPAVALAARIVLLSPTRSKTHADQAAPPASPVHATFPHQNHEQKTGQPAHTTAGSPPAAPITRPSAPNRRHMQENPPVRAAQTFQPPPQADFFQKQQAVAPWPIRSPLAQPWPNPAPSTETQQRQYHFASLPTQPAGPETGAEHVRDLSSTQGKRTHSDLRQRDPLPTETTAAHWPELPEQLLDEEPDWQEAARALDRLRRLEQEQRGM